MTLPPKIGLFLFTLLCLCATGRAATSVREYAVKLKNAQLILESLRQDETGVESEEEARAANAVAYARRELPASEAITGPDGSFTANNGWLHEELDEYEELEVGSAEANAVLGGITQRLSALRDRLEEAQRADTAANAKSKEEQKGQLESILRRPEFNNQPKEENAIQRLWRRTKEWLAKILPSRPVPVSEEQAKRISPLAQVIIYALLIAAVGFGLWRAWPLLQRSRLGRKARAKATEARVVLGEKLAPDQTAADLFAEAEELARRGELRAAIRKGYIALLCELSDRKAVRLEQHKTNYDYLREVARQQTLYQPLRQLTSRFEYHWYGLAPAAPTDWEEFQRLYRGMLNNHS
jgi:hypothetical protein